MISILCGDVHKFFQRELLLSTHARSQGRWRVCEKNILCGEKITTCGVRCTTSSFHFEFVSRTPSLWVHAWKTWSCQLRFSGKINFQLLLLLFLEIFFWYPSKVGILFPKNVVRSSIMGMFATWSHDQVFWGQLFASSQDFCEFDHAWFASATWWNKIEKVAKLSLLTVN